MDLRGSLLIDGGTPAEERKVADGMATGVGPVLVEGVSPAGNERLAGERSTIRR